jgi:hypothetical protein
MEFTIETGAARTMRDNQAAHALHLVEASGSALIRLASNSFDRLQLLAIRIGIVSLPVEILLSCDDVVLAMLAIL